MATIRVVTAHAASAAAPAAHIARAVLARAMRMALVGLVLGAVFSLVFEGGLLRVTVFTWCISMASWLCVDGARVLAARLFQRDAAAAARGWPGWPWMIASVAFGTVAGFSAGSFVAGWLLGVRTPNLLSMTPAQGIPALVISLVVGAVATYVMWSRVRMSSAEARAQKAQREAAENQLRLLQSQLEPHMLFNTLANLRVLIGTDPQRAEAMLDALIAFLRATLQASRAGSHPLSAEFERCADYLSLMQVRMGPRLQSSLDLPRELADVPVPPLLLQPLVENAVRHGVEPQVEGGLIAVGARRDGSDLVLTVRDGGAGLTARPSADGTGFGLAQVRERLATLYGARASLALTSGPAGGAIAIVRLPLPG